MACDFSGVAHYYYYYRNEIEDNHVFQGVK